MEQQKKPASVPLLILGEWGLQNFLPKNTQNMMELTEP